MNIFLRRRRGQPVQQIVRSVQINPLIVIQSAFVGRNGVGDPIIEEMPRQGVQVRAARDVGGQLVEFRSWRRKAVALFKVRLTPKTSWPAFANSPAKGSPT